jgi:hypothetical protein
LPIQEEVDNRTVALSVKAAKLTARVLAKAMEAALRKLQKEHNKAKTPHGRQPVRKLMNHGAATDTIPLDGDTKLFDRVARKYNVDYSFHPTEPGKYLLLFKSEQAGAVTAAFSEFTKLVMARANKKRPPIRETLDRVMELVRAKPRERERAREASHDER